MEKKSDFSMQDAMALAGTPLGQQLLTLAQQKGGKDLQKAMELAAEGNLEQAKQSISSLLEDPQIKALLSALGGNP